METEELTQRIVAILAKVSGKPAANVHLDSALIDDLELDSINFIELDHEIRRNGLPQIPEEDLQSLVKVGDVVRLLSTYLNSQRPAAG